LLDLNTVFTEGRVHDPPQFSNVWDDLPDNVAPKRSLADNAYTGEACLTTTREHGATPLHDLRKDHRYERWPDSNDERLINVATLLAQPIRTAQTASQDDRNPLPGNENQIPRPA